MNEEGSTPPAAGIEPLIRSHQVALLYRNAPVPVIANAINASLLAYINFTLGIPASLAVSWAAALIAIAGIRFVLVRAYRRAAPDPEATELWLRRFFLSTLFAAGVWGIGAFLFMWRAPEEIYLFTGLVISGTVAGGVASLGPVLNVYRGFALLMLLPMASAVLLNAATPLDWAFGIMTIFLLVIVLRGAASLNETVGTAIRLRLEQQALLTTVERARDQAREMVAKLQEKDAALAESEERYRLILQHSPTGILHYNNDLIITYCNERFAEILEVPKERLLGLDMRSLNDRRVLAALENALGGATETYEGEYVTTLSGKRLWISMSCSPLLGPNRDQDGGIGIVEDITERRHDEEALRESEARLRLMLETSPIAVRIAGEGGRKVLFANQRYAELIQSSPEAMLEVNPGSYYANADEYPGVLAVLAQGGQVRHRLVELTMPDGQPKWASASYLMLTYEGEPAVLGWFYDVTQQKQSERQLEHLAMTDSLTGLHNRRSFLEIAERELSRATRYGNPLAILMLDIDHFKAVNDTHGHRVGDNVLKEFARLCQQTLRTFDTVGRVGGEEFAILLPQTSHEQAVGVAERIRQLVEHARLSLEHGLPLQFTVSIGVAEVPDTPTNIDTLLNQADTALYDAKRTGRNRVCGYRGSA
ncbi:MAG: diguanylate cyclase [Gammaproteobacteria bacterium]|nr:diguanylate cyclase [Gammaproteobacteria bacterium]MBU1414163.1 diguanylate cyclase [Gammaproteobacteria bacterium]